MKIKRLILLSVMVVATLLVCVATGFAAQTEQPAAQAADTPSVSIERFNLSFEDSIYIKYAVKLTGTTAAEVGKENFRLLYWTAPQTEYTVENAQSSSCNLGTQEISGEKYYIFSYEDLAAKQMTDNIYARAYVKVGGAEYYSDVEKYSVLQYAYNKLGYTGTASTDAELKTLLTEMLSYGAAAQKYFDYNTDRLADARYYQVTVNGGTLTDDGFESGLFLAGEEVEITAPETDANGVPFSHWENASGATVSEERTATITVGTKNETYTPVYENPINYSQGLEFTSNGDGTCYVNRIGTCTDTDIIIPVVSPAGDSVTSIGDRAFYNCRSLTSVTIPDSVTSIGERAFYYCDSLTSITIPDSVTSIGDWAFSSCSSLTSITIPDSVTHIGDWAFSSCSSLTSITIPDSVTSIGNYAFVDCSSLTSITLPFVGATKDGTSNTHFGYIFGASSYSDNNKYVPTSLKTVVITGGRSIGRYAFYNCSSLTSITILDGVTSISIGAFYNCHSLADITIPSSVSSIDGEVFYGCYSLTDIEIPDGVTSIGGVAFCNCSLLTSITIPDSVTRIGWRAFFNCSSLTTVYYSGTGSKWNNISGDDGNDVLINATVYYYSATQPTTTGKYWHYDANGNPVAW